MLSKTEAGVVVAIDGDHLTILLQTGNKREICVTYTTLKLGDRCSVAFDNSTGNIVNVYGYEEASTNDVVELPSTEKKPNPQELEQIGDDVELECSRIQEGEDAEWELLELDLEFRSVLGVQ